MPARTHRREGPVCPSPAGLKSSNPNRDDSPRPLGVGPRQDAGHAHVR